MSKTTYKFQGIELVLDHADPDTPAMVWTAGHRYSSTYDCAVATGELAGNDGDIEIGPNVLAWLESDANQQRVEAAFKAARGHLPEYQ